MKHVFLICTALCLFLPVLAGNREQKDAHQPPESPFRLYPVGRVLKGKGPATLQIDPKYRKALLGLDQYSHVFVMYWFDRNDTPEQRSILQVHPRANPENPLTGVFACRAPVRPNLIALSLCKIKAVSDSSVVVDYIDAFDDTPILDLKPYVPAIDAPGEKVRFPKRKGK